MFAELTELLDPEPHDGALNMAIDEVLLRGATAPLLRIYRWLQPSVSFGYFGNFRAVAARWPGRGLVRRWTGGGEVPHGEDVTYSIIVPRSHSFARVHASESYRAIHESLAPVLHASVLAETATGGESCACFETAVRFDLVSRDRKVAGAAQRRTTAGLLHQGSIQMTDAPDSIRARLAMAFGRQVTSRPLLATELEAAHALVATKYGTDAWLHRFDRAASEPGETIPCATEVVC